MKRVRFEVRPPSAEETATVGQALVTSILTRIRSGRNADDNPSKPLKPGRNGRSGYPEQKIRRGLRPVRDWTWSGATLAALAVTRADENGAALSFSTAKAALIASKLNAQEKAFAVSPRDREVLSEAARVPISRIVRVRQENY